MSEDLYTREELSDEIARLEGERDFLLRRINRNRYPRPGVGMSSNALVEWALGGEWPGLHLYPADNYDLARCVLAAELAPHHLARKLREGVERYASETGLAIPDDSSIPGPYARAKAPSPLAARSEEMR